MKLLITLCFLAIFFLRSLAIESNFLSEVQCTRKNGSCVLASECPHKVTKEFRKLCPFQKSLDAVCCENFPKDQLNCYQSQHFCSMNCPSKNSLGVKGCQYGECCHT